MIEEVDQIFAEVYAASLDNDPQGTAERALEDFEVENLRGDSSTLVWVKAYAAKIRDGGTRIQAGTAASNAVIDHADSMSTLFDRRG